MNSGSSAFMVAGGQSRKPSHTSWNQTSAVRRHVDEFRAFDGTMTFSMLEVS